MQNLGMILRLMKRIAPGLDVKATAEEVRSRIGDELDYELEAQNQRSMARIYRGHPFIVVPDVVTSMTREKVIVSEFVSGLGFDAIKQLDQPTRDRVGEIVFRFYMGCMYRHHQFSGDPHPGNFLLMDDGKVAFLDFGLFKVMPKDLLEIELACQRAGHEQDGAELKRIWAETGFLKHPENFREDKLLAQFLDATWWYVLDEDIELVPEIATQVMIEMSDPRSSHFGQMRHETLPADHLFGRRVEMLTLAVLSQLRAHGNFHRIAREWIYDDAPVTELGREETEFYASRMTRAFWEDFYGGGKRRWSGRPNASLVDEVAELEPGTALDLGCGEGGDAIWLAAQGWTVTAADISQTALDIAARHAAEAGVSVTWERHDLADSLPAGRFDLVTRASCTPTSSCPGRSILRAAAGTVGGRRHAADRRPRPLGRSTTTATSRPRTRWSPSSRCPRTAGSCRQASSASASSVPRRGAESRIDTVVRFRRR